LFRKVVQNLLLLYIQKSPIPQFVHQSGCILFNLTNYRLCLWWASPASRDRNEPHPPSSSCVIGTPDYLSATNL